MRHAPCRCARSSARRRCRPARRRRARATRCGSPRLRLRRRGSPRAARPTEAGRSASVSSPAPPRSPAGRPRSLRARRCGSGSRPGFFAAHRAARGRMVTSGRDRRRWPRVRCADGRAATTCDRSRPVGRSREPPGRRQSLWSRWEPHVPTASFQWRSPTRDHRTRPTLSPPGCAAASGAAAG